MVDVPVQLVAQVPRVLVVEKTTEIPQFWAAELLKFNTSKPGDEQISFKEYVNRMKEGQNDISHITDESIAAVSSSSFRENLRRKGYEVLFMADPVDEFAVQQPKECDGTKPKSTMREDLEADIAKHTGAAAWKRQPHSIKQQTTKQHNKRERKKERKGGGERGQVEKEKGQEERKRRRKGKEGGRNRQGGQEGRDGLGGSQASTMEMETSDKVDDIVKKISISDQDVYVTSGGRIFRRSDKLESCEVRDGSTVEVTSRMRGGGRHKDKKSKSEKKQTTNSERPEQKFDEESKGGEGSEIIPMDEAMRRLEESEEFQKNMECVSEGSEREVQQKVLNYLACMQKVSWMNKEQFEHLESGVWQAVEARGKGRDEQQEQRRRGEQEQWRQTEQGQNTEQEQSKKGKQVRFGEEQQLGKTGAENAGEPEVMGERQSYWTGRGSTGLVRGGDERFRADETRKGKGKGNGGEGEHEGKGGGFGHNGKQQEMREEEEERVRMAPNMGAGGSHPQATSDPGEGEMAKVMKKRKRF